MSTETKELNAAHAALLGAQCLAAHPQKVSVSKLGEDGIRLVVLARPNRFWWFVAGWLLAAPVIWLVGVGLDYLGKTPDDFGLFRNPRQIFGYIAIGYLAIGSMMLLARFAAGPERDTILEIRPGQLKLDRYVAGDHVVREYSAAEIRGLSIDGGAITVATRTDEFSIAIFLPTALQVAIVSVVAFGIWQDSALLMPNLTSRFGARLAVLHACDRTVITSRLDAAASTPRAP